MSRRTDLGYRPATTSSWGEEDAPTAAGFWWFRNPVSRF